MNEQDIEFMRDARGKAAVKNYNQVMENPLISYMLALHGAEIADVEKLLQATTGLKSDRIKQSIFSKLCSITKTPGFNTYKSDVIEQSYATNNIIGSLNRDYWIAITKAFSIFDVLPASKTAQAAVRYFTAPKDEEYPEFNLENIQKLFADVAQYLSADNLLSYFKQHEKSLVIKKRSDGGLKLHFREDLELDIVDAFLVFSAFATILCATIHDDWVTRLTENKGLYSDLSLIVTGSRLFNLKADKPIAMQMDATAAAKFIEITGWNNP